MRNITASLGYTYGCLVRKVSLIQICAAHKQASQFGPNLDQTTDRESPFYFVRLVAVKNYLYVESRVMRLVYGITCELGGIEEARGRGQSMREDGWGGGHCGWGGGAREERNGG
ncbi:hypothetical protein E2C01_040444 [Portunus trituberculatus]|uniref:Uncharacterized protein n=1 Tax=Portunus trituberculatus TaxID=210409 RepID=A0A5B7FNB7_PORTR|nr:hypothetical protein [Portunus trituberculatus]